MTAISPPAVSTGTTPPTVRPVNPAQYRPALLNVGVLVWLASELMFFSGLFAAWFTLRSSTKVWPPKGDTLDVTTVAIATVLLLLSSATMQMAVHRTIKGDRFGFFGWLALTFALGCLFDGMQISDYASRPFPISRDAFTGGFYVLTGIHAAHVLAGLIGMIIVGSRAAKTRRFGHRTAPAVEFLSYYWHFVDVVWIALFISIFVLKGH